MSRIETLNEMSHLKRSRFGRPAPRHGLKLLHWFANDFLSFDLNNEMYSEYDPDDGEFGFHLFENRYDRNGVKLLPDVDLPYYVVGNLNKRQSNELPLYIREEYSGLYDNSNMDRIIVSMDNERLEKVYVTEHDDRSNYDSDATYRISRGLLKIIQGLSLADFLWRTGFSEYQYVIVPVPIIRNHQNINIPQPRQTPVSQMAITLMPAVSSQRNQDTCIEIDPEDDSQRQTTSITSNTSRRKGLCNCTIL